MCISCPNYILKAIETIEKSGYTAYAVGGCVRDSVMNRTPNDWDMTTDAEPNITQKIFSDFHTIPTGIKHGTVTVIIDSHPVEITTMRVDGKYSDSRHPEAVSFTSRIEEDLARRDFTVNAMAYNPKIGLVDPFNGIDDIKNQTIRCVGNPEARFHEDALRILRAVRFASVLDFDIENETANSLLKNRILLKNISSERIRVELIKLLCGNNVEKILTDFKELIFEIIPELKATDGFLQHTPYHIYDVWTHTVKVVSSIEPASDFRIAALLHDVEKPSMFTLDGNGIGHFKGHPQKGAETAEVVLRRLRFSNAEIKRITSIIRLHDERPNGDRFHLARLCADYGINCIEDTLKLVEAEAYGKNPKMLERDIDSVKFAKQQLAEMHKNNTCLSLAELDINGNDIMAIGIERTKIKESLQFLLYEVVYERVENKKSELVKHILMHNKTGM